MPGTRISLLRLHQRAASLDARERLTTIDHAALDAAGV